MLNSKNFLDIVIYYSFDILWKLERSAVTKVHQEKCPANILCDHALPKSNPEPVVVEITEPH